MAEQHSSGVTTSEESNEPINLNVLPWYKRLMNVMFTHFLNPLMMGMFYGSGYLLGSAIYKMCRAHFSK